MSDSLNLDFFPYRLKSHEMNISFSLLPDIDLQQIVFRSIFDT